MVHGLVEHLLRKLGLKDDEFGVRPGTEPLYFDGRCAEVYITATGVESQLWWLVGALVIGSAIGVYYYLRVMVTLYLVEPNLRRHDAPLKWEQRTGGVMLLAIAILAFVLGVYPQPLLDMVQHAGLQLLG